MTDSTYSTPADGKQGRSSAERLFDLFRNDAKAHVEKSGFTHIRPDGKHQFKSSVTVATQLTVLHVQAHLSGRSRVGVIPLLSNDTAAWGGIDLDLYQIAVDDNLNIVDLCQRTAALSLPLYVGYSTSGGIHIYIFLDEPVAAGTLRKALYAVSKALGLPAKKVEIYPKQETTSSKSGGNSIDLPYSGMKYEGCIETNILSRYGLPMLLDEFLGSVKKATVEQLKSFLKERQPSNGHSGATRELSVLVNKLTNATRELLSVHPGTV